MKRFVVVTAYGVVLGILAVAVWFALSIAVSEAARPTMVLVCHAAGREGTTQFVALSVPANEGGYPQGHFTEDGTAEAGHEDDYLGACVEVEPTATPTDVPTEEPTTTPENTPTDEPTTTPTIIADTVPTGTPNGEEPTPTATPQPKECRQDPCGWLWHLVGPNGQTAWFASYSLRPGMDPSVGKSWYPPSTDAQRRCLGWVSVSNLPGRPLSAAEAQLLTSCMGGQCVPVGR
jgi:hypothetical protein